MGLPDGLDAGCMGRSEGYPKVFTLTDGRMELPSAEMEKAAAELNLTPQPAALAPERRRSGDDVGGFHPREMAVPPFGALNLFSLLRQVPPFQYSL